MEKQKILLPETIIDPHCHGRDMDQLYKTSIYQTLLEARAGSIDVSFFMPNTQPAIISVKVLEEYLRIIKKAQKKLGIRNQQYVFFGATDDNFEEADKALQMPEVVGIKFYPLDKDGDTVTTGTIGVAKDASIWRHLLQAEKYNKVGTFHCDDPRIIKQAKGHPIEAEVSYVLKILEIAATIPGVKISICHVSCANSARLILKAQRMGMQVGLEICAHYLWFDSDRTNWNLGLDQVFYHCYNNLRDSKHREYLIQLIASENPLLWIASDTAGHTTEKKLDKKPGGIPSNQEMVAVIVTLAKRFDLSDQQVARLLSWNAADFFRIPVSRDLIEYRLEERIDDLKYNHGIITNPWNGSRLLFPSLL